MGVGHDAAGVSDCAFPREFLRWESKCFRVKISGSNREFSSAHLELSFYLIRLSPILLTVVVNFFPANFVPSRITRLYKALMNLCQCMGPMDFLQSLIEKMLFYLNLFYNVFRRSRNRN